MLPKNINKPMSQQECVDYLNERGIQIIYEPRALMPEHRGDYGLTNMSVFEAADKLGIWEKTNIIMGNYMYGK